MKFNFQEPRPKCYKCGILGHWAYDWTTTKHHVDFYMASKWGKGRQVNTNFTLTAPRALDFKVGHYFKDNIAISRLVLISNLSSIVCFSLNQLCSVFRTLVKINMSKISQIMLQFHFIIYYHCFNIDETVWLLIYTIYKLSFDLVLWFLHDEKYNHMWSC